MRNALAIFAKAPVVGQVKTRLCPPLSPEQATESYRCFLVDTVARACTLADVQVCLAITPAESEPLFRELLPFPVRYLPQRGESLGEREMNIFIDLLNEGFTQVVVIGSDIPTLPITHLQEAFEKLENPACDAVFGPSSDGGYYLIGAKAVHPALFENISWSTSQVLEQTLAQARLHHLNVSLIPSWYDVDTEEDLQRLAADFSRGIGDDATRTHAFLTRLGLCPAGQINRQ
jgi:rSAM/selenodomain-associated transferase 1